MIQPKDDVGAAPDGLYADLSEEIATADHMDELVDPVTGRRYRVLVSTLDDSKTLVEAPVVEYEGMTDHPFVRGVLAGLGLLAVFPVTLGLAASSLTPTTFTSGVVATAAGFVIFHNLLYRGGGARAIRRMRSWTHVSGLALREDTTAEVDA